MSTLLTNSTRPRDLLDEPFVGSGSKLIAADGLSRRRYGVDIDPRYWEVVLRRWERFNGESALLLDRAGAAA